MNKNLKKVISATAALAISASGVAALLLLILTLLTQLPTSRPLMSLAL